MILDAEYWRAFLTEVGTAIAAWLPALAGAIALLALGWLVARVSQALFGGLFRRIGIDSLASKANIQELLEASSHPTTASALLARLIYYVVLLVFVMAAVESLGLETVTDTLGELVAYLPSVLAALFIVLLGGLASRFISDAVTALATKNGISGAASVGKATHFVLLIVVGIVALQRLGVDTALLVTLTMSIVTAVALALALAFGLGNRELARNVMAGLHAKDEFKVADRLVIRGREGRLVSIGKLKATVATAEGQVSYPNTVLIEEEVTVLVGPSGGEPNVEAEPAG